ncbi:Hpt domain-containing protein [Candidatus Acetothermia bacterium]|nr:Hpt domain-containing protein [Candidatus Acetothermia bacterium]MBI3642626.1 Hpt domain-containing protein [Candidatus Acetothermia bacterium]
MANSGIDLKLFNELKEMVGQDFMGELIDTFLDEAPQLISALQNGLLQNDREIFYRSAHSLKSNAASFGAQLLAEQAKALELLGRSNQLDQVGDQIKKLSAEWKSVEEVLKGLRRDFA